MMLCPFSPRRRIRLQRPPRLILRRWHAEHLRGRPVAYRVLIRIQTLRIELAQIHPHMITFSALVWIMLGDIFGVHMTHVYVIGPRLQHPRILRWVRVGRMIPRQDAMLKNRGDILPGMAMVEVRPFALNVMIKPIWISRH